MIFINFKTFNNLHEKIIKIYQRNSYYLNILFICFGYNHSIDISFEIINDLYLN